MRIPVLCSEKVSYCKVLKIRAPKIISIIVLSIEESGFTKQ